MLKPKLNCAVRRWIASPLNYPQCNHLQDSLSCPEKSRVSRSFFKRFRANTRFQYFVSMVFHNFRCGFHVSFLFSAKHDSVLHCAERSRKTLCRGFVAAARGAAPDPADILKMSAKRLAREPRLRGSFAICWHQTSGIARGHRGRRQARTRVEALTGRT